MEKLLVALIFSVLLGACRSVAPGAAEPVSQATVSAGKLKGEWQITKVTLPVSGMLKVTSFQVADSECLVGSLWTFIPNNRTGSMSLSKTGCPAFSSPVSWDLAKDGSFGFKFVNPGTKAKNVTQGFRLRLANQSADSFQLVDMVSVGGQNREIVYQFEKIRKP